MDGHIKCFVSDVLVSMTHDVNYECSKYGLDANTIDFIGHSLALHRDDRFLSEPALDTVKRVKVPFHLYPAYYNLFLSNHYPRVFVF